MEQQQPSSDSKTGGKVRRLSTRQYQVVMLSLGLLVAVGMILWGTGFFERKGEAQGGPQAATDNKTAALAPPEAKNRPLEVDKYKSVGSDDPRFQSLNDPNRNMNVGAVVGAEQTDRQSSNERLAPEDYSAVTQAGQQQRQTAASRKRQTYERSMTEQRRAARENARLSDPNAVMFRRSAAEIADERRTTEDREINQRTANLLLGKMEKSQVPAGGGPGTQSGTSVIQGNGAPLAGTQESGTAETETVMHGEVSRNTVGQPNNKVGFFYNFSRKNANSYNSSDAILAVVHGQGDNGITVQNGATAKLRLLQNTVFRLNGQDIILEKGTLINGTCTIGDDRVFISITSLVIGTAIHPIQVQAFDLDGLQGLHVPNLSEKNRAARGLTRAAAQSAGSGNYFVGQGNVGQQVGTQVATQAARSVMQGARQLVTARAQNPKVTIRPNYKVLLKSAQLTPTSSTNQDYEGY